MIKYAFNLGIWTMLFFFRGMYKPQWPLFFMKDPDRFMIVVITTILCHGYFDALWGRPRRAKLEKAAKQTVSESLFQPLFPCPFLSGKPVAK